MSSRNQPKVKQKYPSQDQGRRQHFFLEESKNAYGVLRVVTTCSLEVQSYHSENMV